MTKNDLIAHIASQANISKESAGNALNATLGGITEALARKEKVTLVGFGTFSVQARAARTGRNPQTGEPMEVPASVAPKFKAGSALKAAVKDS